MTRILTLLAALLSAALAQAQTLSCEDTGSQKAASCDVLMKVIESEMSEMKQADPLMQLKLIAKAMRSTNAGWGTTRFTLGEDGLADNYCCSCVPGEDCSAEDINDVCSPAPAGADGCPAGDIRAVCTGQFCTGID